MTTNPDDFSYSFVSYLFVYVLDKWKVLGNSQKVWRRAEHSVEELNAAVNGGMLLLAIVSVNHCT